MKSIVLIALSFLCSSLIAQENWNEVNSKSNNVDDIMVYQGDLINSGYQTPIYEDDFEAFNVGDMLAEVSEEWTTWSGQPGGSEDAPIVNEEAYSGTKSVKVEEGSSTDLVLPLGDKISGKYAVELYMYVSANHGAYYNLLHKFDGPDSEWGMEAFFASDGSGYINAGGSNAATFTYPTGAWFPVKTIVNLELDSATYFVNDVKVHEWQWSLTDTGDPGLNQLGAMDIFAHAPGGDSPNFYFDNVTYQQLEVNPLEPPQNLTATVEGMDVHLDWDAPSGGGETEELIYDNGTATGSYSYEGYTMATHMSPAGPCQVLTLKYYTTIEDGDNTFNTNVYEWEGSQPGTNLIYSGTETAIDDDWVEFDVSGENITFDGDFVVGFGSINGTTYLGYDWNLNNGRSWDFDNNSSWSQWNEAYLIRAIVQYTDGTLAEVGPGGYEKVLNTNPDNKTERTHSLSTNNQKPVQNTLGGRELIGYNVYRNNELLNNTPIEETMFDDLELDPGVYSYTVSAVYDEGESSPAGPVEVFIESGDLDPVNNLQAEVDNNTVMLTWETPGVDPQWIHWDDGTNGNTIGLTSGGSFELAAKWDPSHIMDFDGFSITKVKIFPAGFTCDYKLKIQKGPNAGTLVYEQDLTGLEIEAWNEVTLDSPVALDVTKELWVGYEVIEHDAGDFPGGTDSGPAVAGYGDMLNTGSSWVSMSTEYGLDYNWNVQAYVEQADGEPVALNKVSNTEFNNESEDLTAVETETSQSTYSPMAELQGYNAYRDGDKLNDALIEDLYYEDMGVPAGTSTYGVTAVYDEGESPAEEVEVTIQAPLLLPPANLEATVIDTDVELTWSEPGEVSEWIHYDDGTNYNSIGATSGGTTNYAIRFDMEQLQAYDGMAIAKIRFFPLGYTADYKLKVWTGENASNLIHEQMVENPEIEAWNEILLDQLITIDASQELWFGYAAIDYDAGDYPGGCDQGPAVAGYGDMIKLGSSWVSMSNEYGLDYNWNIQGGLVEMDGYPITSMQPIEEKTYTNASIDLKVKKNNPVSLEQNIFDGNRTLQGYNVYRDGSMINESVVTETNYTDESLPPGTFEYYVTAIYDEGESGPSNTVEATIEAGAPHFDFPGGNPADPVWTLYLATGIMEGMNLQAGDEIAIFDGETLVGAFQLDEVLTPEDQFDHFLTAFSTLTNGDGYVPGNPITLKCWDASEEIESSAFEVSFSNPYGDAWTESYFPEDDGEYSIVDLEFFSSMTQNYSLDVGFQFVSSRVEAFEPDMLTVNQPILEELDFVRNTQGAMLKKIGPNWINNIGDWVPTEGYLYRMYNASNDLSIEGLEVDPETPITMSQGYQMISYLPGYPIDAQAAVDGILNNLDFMRDSEGAMLRKVGPNWINNIGNMIPGEGYLAKMFVADELIYNLSPVKSSKVKTYPKHISFQGGNPADPVYSIYLQPGNGIETGDEIAAFDDDKMVGAVKIVSENWQDNELAAFNTLTTGKGYNSGNQLSLKVMTENGFSDLNYELSGAWESRSVNTYPKGDGVYSIAKIHKNAVGLEEHSFSIYPNPAVDYIGIKASNQIRKVRLMNSLGQVILIKSIFDIHTKLDVSGIESGLYILEIEMRDKIKKEKLLIE
ncbi:MAG: T9SS type A sorting domain-containing protein [Bacteroidales bacterium]|nr:T9SS type A sorting domain-containing protein [Bacteroidales bacterium]